MGSGKQSFPPKTRMGSGKQSFPPKAMLRFAKKQLAESGQTMKTGMVLEGGAMRGMYTAGVTDVSV